MKALYILLAVLFIFFFMTVSNAQNRVIVNTSFESSNGYGDCIVNGSFLGSNWGWTSTDNNDFEIWNNNRNLGGITYPARSGTKFVEMNANNSAFLYQTVYIINGESIGYTFYHMARTTNTEKAQFAIYNQTGSVDITKPLKVIANSTQALVGTTGIWKQKTGTWVSDLPTGVYRIGFVTPDGGSVGNLLDDITITLDPVIEIEKSTYSFSEASAVNPRLIVSGTVLTTSTVRITLTPGTALKGSDYANVSYIDISIPAGNYAVSNTFEIPVNIVSDATAEPAETFTISIDASNTTSAFKIRDANSDGFNNGTVEIEILNDPAHGLQFDGVDSYINLGRSGNYKPGAAFTFETWALANNWSSANGTIVSNTNGANGYSLKFNSTTRTIEGLAYINGVAKNVSYSTSNLRIGYHHFAMTFTGSSLNLLVDGVIVNSTNVTAGSTLSSDNAATILGAQSSSGGLVGTSSFLNVLLDETKFWSAARTEAQIQSFMYNEITSSQTDLVSYFNYNHIATETRITDFNNSGNPYNISNFPSNPFTESYAMIVPAMNSASGVSNAGFTANWNEPVLGRTERYYLDVSTNSDFNTFVSGYNSLNVGLNTSYNVTGLSANTTYYYRVRANKSNLGDVGAIQYPKYVIVSSNPLPITLIDFNANSDKNGNITLSWSTANETNNDRFEIYKSYDGKEWIYLNEMKGNANSSTIKNYTYNDKQRLEGQVYYQLKQVDFDGTSTFSPIRTVKIMFNKEISLNPNPTSNTVTINDASNINTIYLIDKSGIIIREETVSEETHTIDFNNLQSGMYFIKIVLKNGEIHSEKIIKN